MTGDTFEGTIDFYNSTGGYGFIESDAVEHDIFFHVEDLDADFQIEERMEVTGTFIEKEKGPAATSMNRSGEQDDETDDNEDTMDESYNFIANGDDSEETESDDGPGWGLGDHTGMSDADQNDLSSSINDTITELDEEVDDELVEVLEDASDLVSQTTINKFECPHEDCGLGHSHPDGKHDIRASPAKQPIPGFNVNASFAEQMEFVPYCHCGANEMAMLVKFYPYIDAAVFKDGDLFEGVREVDPDLLGAVYRNWDESYGRSVSKAIANVAVSQNLHESEVVPQGVRDDVEAFFERRQQIEKQADKAPIGSETRSVIQDNREVIEQQLQ